MKANNVSLNLKKPAFQPAFFVECCAFENFFAKVCKNLLTKEEKHSILSKHSREWVRKSGFERKILKKVEKKFLTNRTGHDILTKLLTRVAITKRDREPRKSSRKSKKST